MGAARSPMSSPPRKASNSKWQLTNGRSTWDASNWIDSDDRVRGGRSESHLHCLSSHQAQFCGHLDITALGGAGFASQRTADVLDLDLSRHSGITIDIADGDGKRYTLTLKDEILPRRDDGRDRSSVSWEFDFEGDVGQVKIPWESFKPTYRGRPKPDAKPLDLENIKRVSFMMRRFVIGHANLLIIAGEIQRRHMLTMCSFFGDQHGDFSLTINHVAAFTTPRSSFATSDAGVSLEKGHAERRTDEVNGGSWKKWLCGWIR